ncbi:hypothetical protein LMUR_11982 [Listeria grayi FSL F6-1183]|nr:hypothetical protein LMUR_11982 [Listeria grayi FSL F6-1183]
MPMMWGPLITAGVLVIIIIGIAAGYHIEYRKRERFVQKYHITEKDIKGQIKFYDD